MKTCHSQYITTPHTITTHCSVLLKSRRSVWMPNPIFTNQKAWPDTSCVLSVNCIRWRPSSPPYAFVIVTHLWGLLTSCQSADKWSQCHSDLSTQYEGSFKEPWARWTEVAELKVRQWILQLKWMRSVDTGCSASSITGQTESSLAVSPV